eukprot:742646-Rhodomonas_salina.1
MPGRTRLAIPEANALFEADPLPGTHLPTNGSTENPAKRTYAEKDLLRQKDLPGFQNIGCYT